MDWLCKPKEWDSMLDGFDNTWNIVRESSESSVPISYYFVSFSYVYELLFLVFQIKFIRR